MLGRGSKKRNLRRNFGRISWSKGSERLEKEGTGVSSGEKESKINFLSFIFLILFPPAVHQFDRDLHHYVRDPLNTFETVTNVQSSINPNTRYKIKRSYIEDRKGIFRDSSKSQPAENYLTSSCLRTFNHSGASYLAHSDLGNSVKWSKIVPCAPSEFAARVIVQHDKHDRHDRHVRLFFLR